MARSRALSRELVDADFEEGLPEPAEERWYACYTRSHHEKRVARVLNDRGVEHYLPVVGRQRQWHDRSKVVEFPLFPGYLFVHITKAQIFDVTCVPGVVTVVMVAGRPVPIGEEEIENIRRFAEALTATGGAAEPEPLLTVGSRVLITGGPFEGIEGVVEAGRGSGRVLVGLAALGQGFAVNVPLAYLEHMTDE